MHLSPTIPLSLNLPGAEYRVIKNALSPGGGSPLHCGGLKLATDPNRVRSGAQFLTVGRPHGSPLKSTNITIPIPNYTPTRPHRQSQHTQLPLTHHQTTLHQPSATHTLTHLLLTILAQYPDLASTNAAQLTQNTPTHTSTPYQHHSQHPAPH